MLASTVSKRDEVAQVCWLDEPIVNVLNYASFVKNAIEYKSVTFKM